MCVLVCVCVRNARTRVCREAARALRTHTHTQAHTFSFFACMQRGGGGVNQPHIYTVDVYAYTLYSNVCLYRYVCIYIAIYEVEAYAYTLNSNICNALYGLYTHTQSNICINSYV